MSAAQYAGENAGEEQALRGLARRLQLVVAIYYDEAATLTLDEAPGQALDLDEDETAPLDEAPGQADAPEYLL